MWFIQYKKPNSQDWETLQASVDVLKPFKHGDKALATKQADGLMRRLAVKYIAREIIWEEKHSF